MEVRHSTYCHRYRFGGRREPVASVAYEYARDGRVAARTADGVRQEYGYDARGRLLSVREGGEEVERYAYDAAGNILKKTVRGRTTEYTYDGANQLVSSTCGGERTEYAYDAAGRLVREGGRTYRYGYLDRVLAVTEGGRTFTYAYRPDGQLARADWGDGTAEDFVWDGLALVKRGGERLLNEPHAGGGSPVLTSSGTAYFSDILGTTLGGKAKGRRYAAARQTAFGGGDAAYFTGKPAVAGLGRVFLFRNYRPDLARWQTADPLGYPDGWNSLAYCENDMMSAVDIYGAFKFDIYDYHRKNVKISTALDLSVVRGGTNPGACLTTLHADINDFTRTLSIKFYVGILVPPDAIFSASVAAGSTCGYTEHRTSKSDATIDGSLVYEGILAHERGHANFAIESIAADLQSEYQRLELQWKAGLYSTSEVREKVLEIYGLQDFRAIVGSGAAANEGTTSWFNNSSEWVNIFYDGRSWIWRKVE